MEDITIDLSKWLALEFKRRRDLLNDFKKNVGTDVGTAIINNLSHVENNIDFIMMLLDKLKYYERKEEEEIAN